MFTGIIADIAEVRLIQPNGDTRFEFTTQFDTASFEIGASIACNGTCLTVVDFGSDWFAADVSLETLSKTTLGLWKIGTLVNLERPLKASDELGGHIVSGHIDGVGKASCIEIKGDSVRYCFDAEKELMKFIAVKGSVAVNGVSLTVNEIFGNTFSVNIIPHTQANTTFGAFKIDDSVNIEIDMLARYVARLKEIGE
jgi:riboflavin synthase